VTHHCKIKVPFWILATYFDIPDEFLESKHFSVLLPEHRKDPYVPE